MLAILSINEKTGEVLFGPDIVTRGLFFEEENPHLIEEARDAVLQTLEDINTEAKGEQSEVKEEVRKSLRRYFNKTLIEKARDRSDCNGDIAHQCASNTRIAEDVVYKLLFYASIACGTYSPSSLNNLSI